MTNTSKTIVFFGTEDYSLVTLKALIEAGFYVGLVITKPDAPRGRGQKLTAPAVKDFAEQHGIRVLQPTKLVDIENDIKSLDSPIGVLVAYGKIIPESVISLFKPGIINIHPSLLPLYRGPSPVESAIINRDSKTGVSLIMLSSAMDAGAVYLQATYDLNQNEYKTDLYNKLFKIGTDLLVQKLPQIINGELQSTAQDETKATYCSLLKKADGLLNPDQLTATEAESRIRAYADFPKSRITIGNYEVIITKAHTATTKNTPLDIEFLDNSILSIDELITPNGRIVKAKDFLNGYKI